MGVKACGNTEAKDRDDRHVSEAKQTVTLTTARESNAPHDFLSITYTPVKELRLWKK